MLFTCTEQHFRDQRSAFQKSFSSFRLLDEAAVSLKAATLRVPDDPMKRYMLGVVHSARGESDEARREIGRALELDPAFPRAESARDLLARLDR